MYIHPQYIKSVTTAFIIMQSLILAILIVSIAARPLVTSEYTDYLRKHVSWEVVDYEDNLFKGWTVDEFKSILGDADGEYIPESVPAETVPLPSSVSWMGAACTHAIHNQGHCGSCWAFATTSVVSDRCCMQSKDFGWLAPQELLSCDTKENEGCAGGLVSDALKYVKANGLVPEACYPYVAEEKACPSKCKDGSSWTDAHVCKCQTLIDCGGLTSMKSCLQAGPIAARMFVYRDFVSYKSGVYCWDGSSEQMGRHAIRCVGYSDTPSPNLNCANSWGLNWGEKGFFRIGTGEDCGLRLAPQDALAVKDC